MTDAEKEFEDGQAAFDGEEWQTAMDLLKPLAERGHADAMMLVGNMYNTGRSVKQDTDEAKKWWHKAIDQYQKHADRGNSLALYKIGMYYHFWNADTDLNESYKWYHKAAEQGSANAMWAIGNLYKEGLTGNQDEREKTKWWGKAVDAFRVEAEQGNIVSQNRLADCYTWGWGAKPDIKEAIKWRRKAAEQGDAVAQCKLVDLLQSVKNVAEAIIWLNKSAEQGYPPAQVQLGEEYSSGHFVAQDYREAAKWWRKAADQSHSMALNSLGSLYAEGKGVPKDFTEAAKWWHKAAAAGNFYAQLSLAEAYEIGRGVPQDHVEAYYWHEIVTLHNSRKEYETKRDHAAKLVTPEQMEAVRKRVSGWQQVKANWQSKWLRRQHASEIIAFLE
jgi:uncharacterized protein